VLLGDRAPNVGVAAVTRFAYGVSDEEHGLDSILNLDVGTR